ncbi:MAG TPA: zinc ribbon domain-containing protein, partial [Candidatus Acidoferrum sp.]|nr:zinc ribbon domain-containing protein [Candidatus Acidoferrum sp.]
NGSAGYRYYSASNSWTASAAGSNVFNYATQVYLDVSTDPTGVTDVTAPGWYAKDASASIASVPSEVQGTTGTKYVYTAWTVDGTPRGGNGFVVTMDAPHNVVAKYDTMFLLTIVSDFGNTRGAGYYKSGETAVFGVDSPVGFGIQHVFVQWSGDYTGNEPQGSITMDGPKTVTAVWTTSYFQLYLIIGAIVAIAVIVSLLVWMRGRGRGPPAMKVVPPPPPPVTEVHETSVAPVSPLPETETVTKPPVSIALRCTNCGHELKQGQIYCPECGQKQID